mgnify:CR=1 FL=1
MSTPNPPDLHVVKGDATPEDIAALLVLFAAQSPQASTAATSINAWNSGDRMLRNFPSAGPGAWRASGLAQ